MNATIMSRTFSKWWSRRQVIGANRFEADAGWREGVRWSLEQAALRLEQGLSQRADRIQADDERRDCAEEVRQLALDLLK